MNSLRGKGLAILAIVLCVAYFGYRFYVGGIDAAVLKEEAIDRSIQRVSVIQPNGVAADRDDYAARQYSGLV